MTLLGHKGNKKWGLVTDMRCDLGHILAEWEGKVASSGLHKEEIGTINDLTSRALLLLQQTTDLPITGMLDEDRELIKRCLHGTLCHEYRRNINKHVRLREDDCKQGRWRAMLNSVLGHLAGKKGRKG